MNSLNGVINVYKEPGSTSFQVVGRIRKIFGIKKVGHTGTLDPMAEGVLPVCIGYATRFADLLAAEDKQYIAKFVVGKRFDSYDITGTLLSESHIKPSQEEIQAELEKLTGDVELVVPAYSAKKIDGERAYKLAREGKLENAGKSFMKIHSIELLSYSYPEGVMVINCGKGTYVRSIIEHMGLALGCGAAMSGLVRSVNGQFNLKDAYKLDEIEKFVKDGAIGRVLKCVEDVVPLKKAVIRANATENIMNGVSPYRNMYVLFPELNEGDLCLITDTNGKLLALGERTGKMPLKLSKVFNNQ